MAKSYRSDYDPMDMLHWITKINSDSVIVEFRENQEKSSYHRQQTRRTSKIGSQMNINENYREAGLEAKNGEKCVKLTIVQIQRKDGTSSEDIVRVNEDGRKTEVLIFRRIRVFVDETA